MKKRNNIIVAVTNDISTDQRIYKVCDYLIKNGFEVTVFGRILPDTFNIDRPYKIVRKKHFFNNHFLFYAEYNIRLFLYLFFKKKYSHILSNDLDTLLACYIASKLKKSKLIYDSHELFTEVPELQNRRTVRYIWAFIEKLLLPKISNMYTVSGTIADYYKFKYNVKIGVVRNVPFLKRTINNNKVQFPTKNKVILYQGVFNPGRGIEPMIKALHFLDNVDIVLIGFGKITNEIIAFVKSEGLENRVHFMGRIDHETLYNYTKIADVGMVLEQPLGDSFKFSLPNKLFDFIHAEVPVIAGSPLIEVKKIIQNYDVGILVDNYEPEYLAEKVKMLLNNQDLINKIKLNQVNAKKLLCWENESKLLNHYFID